MILKRLKSRWLLRIGALFVLFVPIVVVQAQEDTFDQKVLPFLKQYCIHCHGPEKRKSGLQLLELDRDIVTGTNTEEWRDIVNRLNLGDMPPDDEPKQPKSEDLIEVIQWLSKRITEAEYAAQKQNRFTLPRRLTHEEYRNTLKDLFGHPYDPTEAFARDSTDDGFENIAANLRISTRDFEGYLDAAERIVTWLANTPTKQPAREHWRIEVVNDYVQQVRNKRGSNGYPDALDKNLELKRGIEPEFPVPGRNGTVVNGNFAGNLPTITNFKILNQSLQYRLFDDTQNPPKEYAGYSILRASTVVDLPEISRDKNKSANALLWERVAVKRYAIRWYGSEPGIYRIKIKASARPVDELSNAKEISQRLHTLVVRLQPEQHVLGSLSLNETRSEYAFTFYREPATAYNGKYVYPGWGVDLELPQFLSEDRTTHKGAEIHSVSIEGPIFETWPQPYAIYNTVSVANVPQLLGNVLTRAFRRSVSQEELDRYVRQFESEYSKYKNVPAALALPLRTILTAPDFLYILEPKPDTQNDSPSTISDFQLATRLSYFLYKSMPDETLFELARAGKLRSPQTLAEQARRMLRDQKSRRMRESFLRQWLRLDLLDDVQIEPRMARYPADALKLEFKKETLAFFDEIIDRDLSILNFLQSDFATLNSIMAWHYGIDGKFGTEFRSVPLKPEHQRGGLLTHASILALTSDGKNTAPIRRAVYVLDRVLGTPPPPPPPDVTSLEEFKPPRRPNSQRELFEMHRVGATCANCHAKIDPLGFAMENFDALGRWRTEVPFHQHRAPTRMVPVETAGVLSDGRTFEDLNGLKKLLLDRPDAFVEGFIRRMLTFALGRRMGLGDEIEIRKIHEELKRSEYRFSRLIELLVTSQAFTTK